MAQVNTIASEKLLLAGLAKNDTSCVEKIYRDHFLMIKTMVVNNSGSSDDASDIFQEAMIVLYQKAVENSLELHCQLKTYLYSICRRLWLKRLQQLGRVTQHDTNIEETVAVEEDVIGHEKKQSDFTLMEMSMAKIGEPCKSLLEAYYLQKKHMQEIADNFGYTNADNAKTQKYKCLVRLKKIFFAQYKKIEN